ncbi:MAG: hypothetical protein GX306_03060 [Clostridiales bacterium]|jgi:hypothetical protein|nr:hypothetical protein [Clostridiales bacterium]
MITICLDEYGVFEEDSALQDKFVGGIIYQGEDVEAERCRLRNLFEKVCRDKNGVFPRDLHYTYNGSNRQQVQAIKYTLKRHWKKFFQEAKGEYRIFCLLDSKAGRSLYSKNTHLLNDKSGSMMYEHMATEVLENIILYNPLLNDHRIRLEAATRIAKVAIDDYDNIREYEELGYRSKQLQPGEDQYTYFVTDDKTYRTALSYMVRNSEEILDIRECHVDSINYRDPEEMEFLYLADCICSEIGACIRNKNIETAFYDLQDWSKEVTGNPAYLWAYDDVEDDYRRLFNAWRAQDLYRYFSLAYDFRKETETSKLYRYYEEYWLLAMEESLVHKVLKNQEQINLIGNGLSKLSASIFVNNFDENKAYAILQDFLKLGRNINNKDIINKISSVGIAINNHLGKYHESLELYQSFLESYNDSGIHSFLEVNNRIAVTYSNVFQFDRSLRIAEENVHAWMKLKEAEIQIAQKHPLGQNIQIKNLNLGRSYSSCGQYKAFLRRKDALGDFEAALLEFAKVDENGKIIERNPNYYISLSYLLHYAIDQKDYNLYKKYAAEYFGGTLDPKDQFQSILNMDHHKIDRNFAFFVYIKALWYFYKDSMDTEFVLQIAKMDYEEEGFITDGHPWELIGKYLAKLAFAAGDFELSDTIIQNIGIKMVLSDELMKGIYLYTKLDYYHMKKDLDHFHQARLDFQQWCMQEEYKDYFIDYTLLEDEAFYQAVGRMFTYMYN